METAKSQFWGYTIQRRYVIKKPKNLIKKYFGNRLHNFWNFYNFGIGRLCRIDCNKYYWVLCSPFLKNFNWKSAQRQIMCSRFRWWHEKNVSIWLPHTRWTPYGKRHMTFSRYVSIEWQKCQSDCCCCYSIRKSYARAANLQVNKIHIQIVKGTKWIYFVLMHFKEPR